MIEIVDFPWTLFLTSKCIYMFLIWSGSFGYNYDLIFIIISNNFSFKYHQNWVLEDLRLRWSNESTIYTYFLPSNHSENHKYMVREKGPNKALLSRSWYHYLLWSHLLPCTLLVTPSCSLPKFAKVAATHWLVSRPNFLVGRNNKTLGTFRTRHHS